MSETQGDSPTQTTEGVFNRWHARAQNATKAYNFFLRPNKPLDTTSSWFNPLARGRFTGFKEGEFADDLKSLIFKPFIFIGLRLFEPINTIYYFLALLWYVVGLSPANACDSLLHVVESVIATPILEFYACLEVTLQLGSFGMRCMLSVFEAAGFVAVSNEVDDKYDEAFVI